MVDRESFKPVGPAACELSECRPSKNAGILSLLIERGVSSRQIYQVDINHRRLNFQHFTERHGKMKEHDPLLQSMFDSGASKAFTSVTPMSFYFYELSVLEDTESHPDVFLKTVNKVHTNYDSQSKEYRFGYMTGVSGTMLTQLGFKRLCEVFNLSYDTATEPNVSIQSLVSFMDKLENLNIDTLTNLKSSVANMKLDHIFKVDTNGSLTEQVYQLGQLIRSVCPVRLAIPEGQHRMGLNALTVTGSFASFDSAPLKPIPLENTKHLFLRNPEFTKMQVFKTQRIRICNITNTTSMQDVAEALKAFGKQITEGQVTNIDVSLEDIMLHTVEKIHEEMVEPNSKLPELDWGNYWCCSPNIQGTETRVIQKRITIELDDVVRKSLREDPGYYNVLKGSSSKDYDTLIVDSMKDLKSWHGKIIDTQNINASKALKAVVFFAKMASNTTRGNKAIQRFLAPPRPSRDQFIPLEQLDLPVRVNSWDFFESVIKNPLCTVHKAMNGRFLYEYRIIKALRLCMAEFSLEPEEKRDFGNRGFDFSKGGFAKLVGMIAINPDTDRTCTDLGLGNNQLTCNLVSYGIFCQLFTDILETLNKVGPNPKIPFVRPQTGDGPGGKPELINSYVEIYLQ